MTGAEAAAPSSSAQPSGRADGAPPGEGRRPGVVLDVDGTLLDSNYLHVVAWAEAFATLGERPPMADIHRMIGRGSDDMVRRLLGRDEPVAEELHADAYARRRSMLAPLPGAADFVRRLSGDLGLRVVLASSASPDDHRKNLEVLGLDDEIAHAVAAGDADRAKPAPDLFTLAVDEGGLDPRATVVVGDSRYDVEAATRADLPAIGLGTGGICLEELRGAGAVETYGDLPDLLDSLDRSILAGLADRTAG
ncbi:MAG: HAD family hydrolase [Acidimicrobiales bacterium]